MLRWKERRWLLLLVSGVAFHCGCGSTVSSGSGGTGGGGVSLSTTVKVPTSVSASLSKALGQNSDSIKKGLSVSKGISASASSSEKVIRVAKADSAAVGATCKLLDEEGNILATSRSDITGKCQATGISPSKIDLTAGAFWEVTAGKSTLLNCCTKPTNAVEGESVVCGDTDSKANVTAALLLKAAGLSSLSSAYKAKVANKTVIPSTFVPTNLEQLTSTKFSSGSDKLGNVLQAMLEAASNMMALGNEFNPDMMFDWLDGKDLSEVDTYTAREINTSQWHSTLSQGLTSMRDALADEGLFEQYKALGEGAADYMGDFIGNMDAFGSGKLAGNYLEQALKDARSGGLSGLSKIADEGRARMMWRVAAQSGAETTFSDTDMLEDFMENMDCSGCDSAALEKQAKGVFNNFKVLDNASEIAYFRSHMNTFATQVETNRDLISGESGDDFFNNLILMGAEQGSSGDTQMLLMKPCGSSADCGSGESCVKNMCRVATVSGSCTGFGCYCNSNDDCSGSAGGYCNTAVNGCDYAAGVDAYSKFDATTGGIVGAKVGSTCTTNADCFGNPCVSGSCQYFGFVATPSFTCSATGSDDFSDAQSILAASNCWTITSQSACLDSLTVANGQLTIDQKNVGNTSCIFSSTPFKMVTRLIPANKNFTVILSIASWSNLDTSGANFDGVGVLVADVSVSDLALRIDMRALNAGGEKQACYLSNDNDINESEYSTCNVGANYSGGMCLKLVRTGTNVVGSFKTGTSCSDASGYSTIGTLTNYSDPSGSGVNIITSDGSGAGTLSAVIDGITIQY